MKTRYLDHIDLRVKNFDQARHFYARLLPRLGFSCDRSDQDWGTFYAVGEDRASAFFGFTTDPNHQPNGTRIAFWAESRSDLDRIGHELRSLGAKNIEGPELCAEYSPGYYAVFFEDPDGNKLEICFRESPVIKE
jgi:catechol 2,3-dioxygenase-like lactoylglutathione lyase family enzyme